MEKCINVYEGFLQGKQSCTEEKKQTEWSQVVVLSKAGEHLSSGRTV